MLEQAAGELFSEEARVRMRRYQEARAADMPRTQAQKFAASDVDVGELRRLVKKGCPPPLLAKVLL